MPTVGNIADVVVEGAPLPMLADGGTETVSLFVEDVVDVVVGEGTMFADGIVPPGIGGVTTPLPVVVVGTELPDASVPEESVVPSKNS